MDRIKIQILDDGTIKSTTDAVSPENHENAEAFLTRLAKETGSEIHRVNRGDAHVHHHHGHTHSHSHEHGHSH